MAEFKGNLLSDLRSDGTVRVTFVIGPGTRKEPVFVIENLDIAEFELVRTFGMTPECVTWMRSLLERNKVFVVEVSLTETVAAMFGYK
jgi:hypothetical protein